MKRFLIGSILTMAAVPVLAQDDMQVDIHAGLSFATKDVWRGINLVDDAVMTPNVHFSYGDWTGFMLGRMELTNTNSYPTLAGPRGNFTAFRAGVFYTFNYDGAADVTVGAMAHQYPDAGPRQTQELYYGFKFGGAGNFKIEIMQDVQTVKGYYVRASISSEFPGAFRKPNGDNMSLTMGAHLGYGDNKNNLFYYGANSSTLTDLSVWMETSFDVNDKLELTPYLEYTSLVDPDMLKAAPNRTNFMVGVRLHYKF